MVTMEPSHDAPPATLLRSPTWLISQASIHAQRLLNERLAAVGARRYHYSVLSALGEYGSISQAALGRHCHLDRSDIAAVVAELSDNGFITREPDPADRRRNIVSISAGGKRYFAQLDELVSGAQADLLAPLSPEERRQLTALMGRVVAHHAELKGSGWA